MTPGTEPSDFAPPALSGWCADSRVRLRTLILLRWFAIAGQTITILLVAFWLQFEVLLGASLAVVAASAWLNLFLMVALPSQKLVKEWEAALQLAFDVLQLAALLALTGGIANPFLLLFIAPLAVSASVLRPQTTAALAALAFFSIALLAVWHLPLPWRRDEALILPYIYQLGLVAAVLIGLGFTSVYAWRVATEEERLSLALSAVQAVLSREQRMSALGGLAAAAAHELGTPLATIHLIAKEMARELPKDSPLMEDCQLLVSQSERCKQILKQLSQRPETSDAVHARMPLSALLEEAAGPHKDFGIEVLITAAPAPGQGEEDAAEPEVRRMPEVIHGLGNIIENAVGFAEKRVEVIARWTGMEVELVVRDDGPGFPPNVLPRLGEPYVSERRPGDRGGGMGLGFFIAKTLLERAGGRVEFKNRPPPAQGAVVRAVWVRRNIEAPPMPATASELGTTA
jgi:two-component system sensor histidine kinase RegB